MGHHGRVVEGVPDVPDVPDPPDPPDPPDARGPSDRQDALVSALRDVADRFDRPLTSERDVLYGVAPGVVVRVEGEPRIEVEYMRGETARVFVAGLTFDVVAVDDVPAFTSALLDGSAHVVRHRWSRTSYLVVPVQGRRSYAERVGDDPAAWVARLSRSARRHRHRRR